MSSLAFVLLAEQITIADVNYIKYVFTHPWTHLTGLPVKIRAAGSKRIQHPSAATIGLPFLVTDNPMPSPFTYQVKEEFL